MRTSSLLLLSALVAVAFCNKQKFITKGRNLLIGPKVTDAMINKLLPMVTEPMLDQKSMDDIVANVMKKLPGQILSFTSLLPVYTGANGCFKDNGVDLMKAIDKFTPVLTNNLKGPYNTVMTLIKNKTNQNVKRANIETQAYAKCTAIMTKALIKKIVINAKKKLCVKEWSCADKYLNQVIKLSDYDDKKDATCAKKC